MEFFRQLANPTDKQLAWLKSWFWRTTYNSFFTNGSISDHRKEYDSFMVYLETGEYVPCDFLKQNSSLEYVFPEKINLRGVRSRALVLFVINHLFQCCPKQMHEAVYRQTNVISAISDYYNPCTENTLFTDVEAKAYKHLTAESADLLSTDDEYREDWAVLNASFFDDLNQLDSRRRLMTDAEKTFIKELGFEIK
jgi:hypothetical protein